MTHRIGVPTPRRAILLVALLVFLQVGAASQLALWCASGAAGPDADVDFPCAGHHCGCLTAEQCRTDCCCFPVALPAARSCCSADAGPDAAADAGALAVSARPCRGGDGRTAPPGQRPFLRPAGLRHTARFVFFHDVFLPAAPAAGTDPAPPGKIPIGALAT